MIYFALGFLAAAALAAWCPQTFRVMVAWLAAQYRRVRNKPDPTDEAGA